MAKPSPKRTKPVELAQIVQNAVVPVQSAKTAPAPVQAKPVATVQVNFRASMTFAKLIAELAETEGGTRQAIANAFRKAGHAVPDADCERGNSGRRRFD